MSSEWNRATLGDLLTLQRGLDLPTQDRKNGAFPVVASTGIVGYHSEGPVKGPGVVIGRSGSIGGGQYIDSDFWPLNTTLWVKDFKGNDPRFCYYLLKSMDFDSLNAGSGVPTLNRNHLHPLPVEIPPISEQKKISDILGLIDDQISLCNKINTSLQDLIQVIFKSWFIDFDPVKANQKSLKINGISDADARLFPSSFSESNLGLIPSDWEVGQLGDLVSLKNERVKPSADTERLPYVPIESISPINPFLSDTKDGREAKSSLVLFKKNDILFGAMRPYFHKVCLAPFDGVTRTTVFTLSSKNINAVEYALFHIFDKSTIEYATQHSEGSTIPYAKWKNSLEKMPVVIAPRKLQERFSELASPLIDIGNKNVEKARSLKALSDLILPSLIKGKINLSDLELNIKAEFLND